MFADLSHESQGKKTTPRTAHANFTKFQWARRPLSWTLAGRMLHLDSQLQLLKSALNKILDPQRRTQIED